MRANFGLGFRAAARVTSLACPREVTKRRAPCLAPMLRIGSLRGSGRKRASRKLASLKHPAVYSAYGLHCSALRPRASIQASSLSLAQGHGFCRSAKRSVSRQERSHSSRFRSLPVATHRYGLRAVFGSHVKRTRSAGPKGVRRTAPVRPACLRIAKAIRVLAASLRHAHRSGSARSADA